MLSYQSSKSRAKSIVYMWLRNHKGNLLRSIFKRRSEICLVGAIAWLLTVQELNYVSVIHVETERSWMHEILLECRLVEIDQFPELLRSSPDVFVSPLNDARLVSVPFQTWMRLCKIIWINVSVMTFENSKAKVNTWKFQRESIDIRYIWILSLASTCVIRNYFPFIINRQIN